MNSASLDESDKKLLETIKLHLFDFLDNSYSSLMEEVFT
jgi:hypothetical protein